MSRKLLEFDQVNKKFGDVKLIENINFLLLSKQITTLIGQNGAGKTTIAKLILDLDEVTSGNIIRYYDDITISYVPQKSDINLSIPMTCSYLLQMLLGNKNTTQISELLDDNLLLKEFSNIDKLKNNLISNLSGGELQKLLLTAAILRKPDLLILDEPTQYLDVVSQRLLYKILSNLRDKYEISIFLISHDMFAVLKDTDQIICINKHVCCTGKPDDIHLQGVMSEIGIYNHLHDHKH